MLLEGRGIVVALLLCSAVLTGCELVAGIEHRELGGQGGGAGGMGAGGANADPCPPGSASGCLLWALRLGDASVQSVRDVAVDGLGNIFVTGVFSGALDCAGETLSSKGLNDIFVAKLSPMGQQLWCRAFGSASDQDSWGDLALDGNGNVIVAGDVWGGADFGDGWMAADGRDVFVAKLSGDGDLLWAKLWGGAGLQYCRDSAIDSAGNIVLVGFFDNDLDFGGGALTNLGLFDIFVAKIKSSGDVSWAESFGGVAKDYGVAVVLDDNDDIYVGGNSRGDFDLGGGLRSNAGGADAFLAKYDVDGLYQWDRVFGAAGDDGVRYLSLVPLAGVALSARVSGPTKVDTEALSTAPGTVVARLDAGGTLTAHIAPSCTAPAGLATTVAGAFVVGFELQDSCDLGDGPLPAQGGFDFAIAARSSGLQPSWSKSYGSPTDDFLNDIAVAADDSIVAVGSFTGTVDFGAGEVTSAGDADGFVIKLTP